MCGIIIAWNKHGYLVSAYINLSKANSYNTLDGRLLYMFIVSWIYDEGIWYRVGTRWHKSWSFVCKIPLFRWECLFFSHLYYFSSCLCILNIELMEDNLSSNSQSLTIMFNRNILHHQSIGSFFCCVINVCFNKIVVMRERFAKVTA